MSVPSIKVIVLKDGLAHADGLDLPPAKILIQEAHSIALKIPGAEERCTTSVLYDVLSVEGDRLRVHEVARWEHMR